MWDSVSNIAAIVAIILLFQLLGLPDWIDKTVRKRKSDPDLAKRIDELDARIVNLENKVR